MWKQSQINYQGFKIKAFSLLEMIIAILVIGLISTFIYPRFTSFEESNSFIKLKSEYNLILSGIKKYKTKKILKNEDEYIKLDDAAINTENEKLFSNVVDFEILSTNTTKQERTKWTKISQDEYKYFLTKEKSVDFKFEDNKFKCISAIEICKKLY